MTSTVADALFLASAAAGLMALAAAAERGLWWWMCRTGRAWVVRDTCVETEDMIAARVRAAIIAACDD